MSTRPVRSNRGQKRLYPEQQVKKRKKDNQFQKKIDRNNNELKKQQEFIQNKINLSKTQLFRLNILEYPFCRSHHYFYKLQTLQRIQTTSYVQDPNIQIYHFQKKKLAQINSEKVQQSQNIINRKYIGLPYKRIYEPRKKQGDKNPCHDYLFMNQDRKFKLDQQLFELKYLLKHPKMLEQGNAKNFSLIKKQLDLAPLLDINQTLQNKIKLIKLKVQALQNRKMKSHSQFEQQDKFFFKTSLNQSFFNIKNLSQSEIQLQNIYSQAQFLLQYQLQLFNKIQYEQIIRRIRYFFTIYSTIGRVHSTLQNQTKQYYKNHLKLSHLPPSYIYNFTNNQIFQKLQQILSIRILQLHGDSFFYILKTFWKRIFNRDLSLQTEFVAIKKQQYFTKFKYCVNHYQNKVTLTSQDIKFPLVSTKSKYYFGSINPLTISSKDFTLIYFIYYIYERVGYFNLDYKLIADESFSKYSYNLIQKLNNPYAANLDSAIRRFIQILLAVNAYEMGNISVKWQFKNDIGFLWLTQPISEGSQKNSVNEDISSEIIQTPVCKRVKYS